MKPQNDKYWEKREYTDEHLDWRIGETNWIDGYWKSLEHPHRKLILNALEKLEPFESLLEAGCNCGPNLYLIQQKYPKVKLFGTDINHNAITKAKLNPVLEKIWFSYGNINSGLSFEDKKFDIVLADAVLMYIESEKIREVLKEFDRITKKGIIIVDWYNPLSLLGKIKDFHWTRNYTKLLKEINFETEKIKLTKELWPSETWSKHGFIFISHRV